MAPGEKTAAVLARGYAVTLNPVQRRGLRVNTRVAWTRYRCWRLGVNVKNPR